MIYVHRYAICGVRATYHCPRDEGIGHIHLEEGHLVSIDTIEQLNPAF